MGRNRKGGDVGRHRHMGAWLSADPQKVEDDLELIPKHRTSLSFQIKLKLACKLIGMKPFVQYRFVQN